MAAAGRHRGRARATTARGVLEEFAAWVNRQPEAEAVVCRDRSLTYRRTRPTGEPAGQRCSPAGPAAGPGRRPARPGRRDGRGPVRRPQVRRRVRAAGRELPRERLAFMLDDAAPTAIVTTDRLWAALGGQLPTAQAIPVVRWTRRPPTGSNGPAAWDHDPADARARITADSLAYVIYTSGSTGRPKGVVVTHAGSPIWSPRRRGRRRRRAGPRPAVRLAQLRRRLLARLCVPLALRRRRSSSPPRRAGARRRARPTTSPAPGHRGEPAAVPPAPLPDDGTARPDVLFVVGGERCSPNWSRRWAPRRRRCSTPTARPRPPSTRDLAVRPLTTPATAAHRPARPQHAGLRAGRGAAPGARRRAGRAVPRAARAWPAATSAGRG